MHKAEENDRVESQHLHNRTELSSFAEQSGSIFLLVSTEWFLPQVIAAHHAA